MKRTVVQTIFDSITRGMKNQDFFNSLKVYVIFINISNFLDYLLNKHICENNIYYESSLKF